MSSDNSSAGTGRMLLRGASVRVAANFAQMAVALGLTPFILAALGDHHYGLWVVVSALLGFYGILDLGVSSAVARFTSRAMARDDETEFRSYFATSFWLLVGLGALVLLLTTGFALLAVGAIAKPADEDIVFGIVMILGSSLAILFPGRAFTGLLAAHLRYDLVSLMQIVCVLARLPLVVLVFWLGGRLLALALTFAGLQFVESAGVAFFAFRVHRGLTLRVTSFSRERAREIVGYGYHTLVAQIADLMRFKLAPVVITAFASASMAGFYDFADKLNRIVGELSKALMSVLSPVFSRQDGRGDTAAMRQAYLFTTKIAAYVAVLLGGMMFLFGGAFLERWVGARFAFVVPAMQVLVLGTVFGAAQMPTVQFLFGTSRHKNYAWNNVVHGVLVLVATIVLVQPYGLMGVAIAATVPTIAMKFFVIPVAACRALDIPLHRFYLRHALLPMLVPLPFLGVCALVTAPFLEATYLSVFACGAISCIAFVPYVFFVGFASEERQRLSAALRRRRASVPAPEGVSAIAEPEAALQNERGLQEKPQASEPACGAGQAR